MGYLQAKKDLEFMEQFKSDVYDYWCLQGDILEGTTNLDFNPATNEVARQSMIKKYQPVEQQVFEIREKISKTVRRASRIATKNGASIIATSYPAPAIGGPIVRINLFDAILHDYSDRRIGNNEIWDGINETIGGCEERLQIEWSHLKNPLYWIRAAFTFVLRIPFMIVAATGFDVGKVEDHFLAKLFKLIEVIVIFYVLLRLGAGKEGLVDFFKGFIK
ncbi:MAG: hypothetical protein ACREA9_24130 [Pyrinomonadaceae bacterium]